MLDRTLRLDSGAVDLAKEVVGPGKRVDEGRPAVTEAKSEEEERPFLCGGTA